MRSSLLASAFVSSVITCGRLVLRPLTAGSMMLLMEARNVLFTSDESAAGPPTASEQMAAFFEFIWLHTAPMEDVLAATPATVRAQSRALALTISMADLAAFTDQFSGLQNRIAAASVTVDSGKDTPPGKQEPAPAGSPRCSTPSAPLETPPASSTSSGASPSSEPSSTSTPPISPQVPPAAGPCPTWEGDLIPGEELTPLP